MSAKVISKSRHPLQAVGREEYVLRLFPDNVLMKPLGFYGPPPTQYTSYGPKAKKTPSRAS
jgi:hypothetical protein